MKFDWNSFKRTNSFIVIIFILLSILSASIMMSAHFVGGSFDLQFNWQRIYELRESIAHFDFFPKFALNQFNQDGSAVMAMYPNLNLYPAAILSSFISFVPLVYILFMLRTLSSLLIAYFSSYRFGNNKKISFLFSISYSMSTLVISYCFHNMDMGVSASMAIFPLVLFGLFDLFDNNRWIELSIGMSLLIMSHILSTIFISFLLIIIVIINFRKFNKPKIIALLQAIILTLTTTAIFWIPFLNLMLRNKINPPMDFGLNGSTSWTDLLNESTSNVFGSYTITIVAFLGLVLSLINYKKFGSYTKQMFWISILLIFMCSNWFPWGALSKTFVNVIQFPWRLYIIPQLLLCYLFSSSIILMGKNNHIQKIVMIVSTLVVLCIQMVGQNAVLNHYSSYPELQKSYASNGSVQVPVINSELAYKIADSSNIKNVLNSEELDKDYYPVNSLVWYDRIVRHQAIFNIKDYLDTKLLGNGKYEFTNKKDINELNLPFFWYNGIDYDVKMDGNLIASHPNNTNLLTINNIPSGNHIIVVSYHGNLFTLLGYVFFICSLVFYIKLLYKKIEKKRLRKKN